MSASALVSPQISPQIRGACPGLSAPMPTGDGLLVRLNPIGTIPLAAFSGLCAAARQHGNGVIEITSRGSIQVRGLNAASAPRFADAIAALGIAVEDGIPVLSNPLAGLAAAEILNAGTLAADLRRALARKSLAARVGAKVSVAIDGGGALNLDGLIADIRLRAGVSNDDLILRVSLGGDSASAVQLGSIADEDGVEAAVRLLEVVASRGRGMRARDILAAEGIDAFRQAVTDLVIGDRAPPRARQLSEAIGIHPLLDGSFAYGIGLAFGHTDAPLLEYLTEAARAAGAIGFRAAGRALLTIGLMPDASSSFATDAERLGFIVRADDPRRHVVACAGAPACASAHIAARAMAPLIAASTATQFDNACTIHISGCAKGCAHAARAALTVVGTPEGCALIANGSARDAPFAVVSANELPTVIANYARANTRPVMSERTAYLRDGTAIYQRSFAIIRAEADLSRFSAEEAEVAVRMIHACGQVEAAQHIVFGGDLVAAARGALAAGAPILCDAEMVAHGITRARLPARNEVICTLNDPRTAALAAKNATTRSAAALDLWLDRLGGAVVAIGNAPTALFRLLDLIDDGAPKPAAVVGIPVGFVGAAESKEALVENPRGLPFVTCAGASAAAP